MKKTLWLVLAAMALAVAPAGAACVIDGSITAEMNDGDPSLGAWCYTLEVIWDTDAMTALSHLDLFIDGPNGTCDCEAVTASINLAYPAGHSDGEPDGCNVDYEGFIECNGDPSIPLEGILLKWEPLEMPDGCEPGPVGTGYFTFYSDNAPVPVDDSLPLLAEKNDGQYCGGLVGGVFPALPCDPVATEAATWTEIKGLYDR
jgi:hypothetical protein